MPRYPKDVVESTAHRKAFRTWTIQILFEIASSPGRDSVDSIPALCLRAVGIEKIPHFEECSQHCVSMK